jgi:hypothetical protein
MQQPRTCSPSPQSPSAVATHCRLIGSQLALAAGPGPFPAAPLRWPGLQGSARSKACAGCAGCASDPAATVGASARPIAKASCGSGWPPLGCVLGSSDAGAPCCSSLLAGWPGICCCCCCCCRRSARSWACLRRSASAACCRPSAGATSARARGAPALAPPFCASGGGGWEVMGGCGVSACMAGAMLGCITAVVCGGRGRELTAAAAPGGKCGGGAGSGKAGCCGGM